MSPGSGTADGVRAERFVVCHNPDAAARDAGVRQRLIEHLSGLIEGSDTWPDRRRDELVGSRKHKAGLRRLLVRTKTGLLRTSATYSDADSFCVAVIVENPNDEVEIDWQEMTIDVLGHTLVDWWDADLAGTTGWVTAKPSDATRTIGAHNKTSFGLCLKRDATTTVLGNEQIRIRDLRW